MEKVVKAKKDHECAKCGKLIKKGDQYLYLEFRTPVFINHEPDGKQIGIDYQKYRIHTDNRDSNPNTR